MNVVTLAGKLKKTVTLREVGEYTVANIGVEIPAGEKSQSFWLSVWGEEAKKLDGAQEGTPVSIQGSLKNKKSKDSDNWELDVNIWRVQPL